MKFVLIPDSFKGTLSSEQICEIAKEKVEKHFPGAETACVPVADGGEGSVDAFITALGGSKVTVKVKNPYFEDMDSYYGLINEGKTAVIEMAGAAGITQGPDEKRNGFLRRTSISRRPQGPKKDHYIWRWTADLSSS